MIRRHVIASGAKAEDPEKTFIFSGSFGLSLHGRSGPPARRDDQNRKPRRRPSARAWHVPVPTFLFLLLFLPACSKGPAPQQADEAVLKLREAVAEGRYDEGIDLAKAITSRTPPHPNADEALYLQAYLLAYGRSDFQAPRLPLKHLLDLYPQSPFAAEAQKLLADCHYWKGHYETAVVEYGKLLADHKDSEWAGYARFQAANSQLLDDRIVEAQSSYRELVKDLPGDPLADSAQMMLANTYLKLQNYKEAKSELKKLVSFTRDKGIQKAAQKALRQIEEEEPFRGGVEVVD